MTEIELNVMTRQCLPRRIETIDLLCMEFLTWENRLLCELSDEADYWNEWNRCKE